MPQPMLPTTPSTGEVLLALGLVAIAVVVAAWLASGVYSEGLP